MEKMLVDDPRLNQFVGSHSNIELDKADLITDDWPYLYQQYRGVPVIVWLLSLSLIAVCWLAFNRLKNLQKVLNGTFSFLVQLLHCLKFK